MAAQAGLAIREIKPTVFFKRKVPGLFQAVDLTVRNPGARTRATLTVGLARRPIELGFIAPGDSHCRIFIPDIRRRGKVEFILQARGKVQDRRIARWEPRRHWRVFIIPITHHDYGYTEPIEQVLPKYAGFYEDILRFCDQTRNWPAAAKYRYTVEQAWSVQHFIENASPQSVKKLIGYVRQGRIEIPAFFGNHSSALCGHEELVRLMYPSFRLRRKYGFPIRSASITDVPGLAWALPQMLAGAGVKYFFAGLPDYFEWGRKDIHTFWDEARILRRGRPDAFRWQGPDGSSVLVYYQGSYGFFQGATGPHSCQEVLDNLPGKLEALEQQGALFDVARYIHNGVDNWPPDMAISRIARDWNKQWAYPQLSVATNAMFFAQLEKQCGAARVFKGELPDTDYVVGAVSTAKETGLNRLTHDALPAAEKFAVIAAALGDYSYPAARLRAAYDNLLLYDEHTWGMAWPMGQQQDWNWSAKRHCAYKAAGLAESVLSQSLAKLAGRIGLKPAGDHIVVFNPLAFKRSDVVQVAGFSGDEPFALVDEQTGAQIPCQIRPIGGPRDPLPYAAQRYAMGQWHRPSLFNLNFVAERVPALGYRTYRIVPARNPALAQSSIKVGRTTLENRFFKIVLDPRTGAIAGIYDKEQARELVDRRAPHQLNQLIVRWAQTGKEARPEKARIKIGQTGPVCGSLLVAGQAPGCPQITQEIVVYDRLKRIEIRNRLLKDSTPLLEFYFAFPFLMERPEFRFEGANSVVAPLRDQFPGSNSDYYAIQHWADVSDGKFGVAFAPLEAPLVEFGGLWPGYVSQAHHGVTPPGFAHDFLAAGAWRKGYIYSYVMNTNFRTNFQSVQDGDLLFRYALATHAGDYRRGNAAHFGWSIANPLIPVCVKGPQPGGLKAAQGFCEIDRGNVLLSALKKAEDGRGIIARLIETQGKDSRVALRLPFLHIKQAWRTNLVEEDEKTLPVRGPALTVPIKAFGIATVRIIAN